MRHSVADPTGGFSINTSERLATMTGYHRHYSASEGKEAAIAWTGSLSNCNPGTVSDDFQDAVLRRINYFRAQAGLPSNIVFDAAKNAECQQAALVMAREKNLSHTPLKDFEGNPCVTLATEVTASSSSVA